ncbi:MAG: TetR/AcrR family transcriptional regulator [Tenuifilaceae bacterium]|jgi:AcrR family transcriptional regulator|nr:TetR/AcrR family transcriptional regulator [Tenuifilaceae bacterium]
MKFKSKKHQHLVESAKDLFWKFGFKRVTVEEICETASVSKMTFYRFYPNKMEVAKAVFDMVIDKGIDDFRELMKSDMSAPEKMRKMLLMKFEGTNDISKEFMMDFYNNPDLEISAYIQKRTGEVWMSIIEDFRQGQRDGWMRKDFKPEFILFASQKIMELTSDEKMLGLYANPQELVMEIANFFTYGISTHE